MTKTLPILFTATILIAGIFAIGMTFDNADAAKPNPKVKPFKCSSSGTFSGDDGTFSQTGTCSHMGKTTTSGTFGVTGVVGICLTIESTKSQIEALEPEESVEEAIEEGDAAPGMKKPTAHIKPPPRPSPSRERRNRKTRTALPSSR